MTNNKSSGKFIINFALFSICVGILAGTSVPAFKHKNQRDAYRELTDAALSVTNSVEKCLGLERDSSLCDSLEKLIPYGFSSVDIELNPLITTIDFSLESEKYQLSFLPPENNEKASFILPIHDYIRETEIIDRDGRPVIETWVTNPKSGCLRNGFCS